MKRTILTAITAALAPLAAAAEPFTFVALGDMPYGDPAEVYSQYEALIDAVNAADPALVVHVGDTKSGSTQCTDAMLDEQLAFLNSFRAPVLYTPGDNEWTDCHRKSAGGFDPLDRLDYIRRTYFREPGRSFGEAADVETQADAGYPENARTMLNDVMFLTAHVVGSNNNFETRDMAAVAEFKARDAATTQWLREGFGAAGNAAAVVVAIHADMFGDDFNGGWSRHSGFNRFGSALKEEVIKFGKPVLLIYGDSHVFEQERPFPTQAPNLMALQVPGAGEMHAVEITADPESSGVFAVALIENPALF